MQKIMDLFERGVIALETIAANGKVHTSPVATVKGMIREQAAVPPLAPSAPSVDAPGAPGTVVSSAPASTATSGPATAPGETMDAKEAKIITAINMKAGDPMAEFLREHFLNNPTKDFRAMVKAQIELITTEYNKGTGTEGLIKKLFALRTANGTEGQPVPDLAAAAGPAITNAPAAPPANTPPAPGTVAPKTAAPNQEVVDKMSLYITKCGGGEDYKNWAKGLLINPGGLIEGQDEIAVPNLTADKALLVIAALDEQLALMV